MKLLSGQSSGGMFCRCRKELEPRSQLQRGVMPSAISPLSLRVLFRFPCSGYMPGGFIAELLSRYLEGDAVTAIESKRSGNVRDTRDVESHARTVASQARRNLRRLMPFEQWCARIGPTEAAKELYVYVRSRLEQGAAGALRSSRGGSRTKKKGT